MYAVITENDVSQWDDDTGILYHFPKRYSKQLLPGSRVIYYKGRIRDKQYSPNRLSDKPHYFGIATLGKVFADKASTKGDLFAIIADYRPFARPVLAKNVDEYFEIIPEHRKSNYWRDGVRAIDEGVYKNILSTLAKGEISDPEPPSASQVSDDDTYSYESGSEGEKKSKFITYYERNPKLRRQAIAIHGCTCAACGFNFGEFYGEYAEGFIHVHHVKPVSELGGSKVINPETDLIPLCANCHSVVHRKPSNTLSISELKQHIQDSSNLPMSPDSEEASTY